MKKGQLIDLAQSLGLNPGKLLKPAHIILINLINSQLDTIIENNFFFIF